jgi:hypothetical protein
MGHAAPPQLATGMPAILSPGCHREAVGRLQGPSPRQANKRRYNVKKQKVLSLRPTQFAIGMLEVDEKIKIVRDYNRKQLCDFIDETPVPVVISPQGELYIIDHHHFLAVCLNVGIKKVRVRVAHDLSKRKMSYSAFWKWMLKNRNAYPFCQFGQGPHEAIYLPRDIRGLADDPYRSIAWFVRKAGAFENSDKNFCEFKWANFFRARRLLDRHGPAGMTSALVKAAKLAQSPAARRLPGYGELKAKTQEKVQVRIKKTGSQLRKEN